MIFEMGIEKAVNCPICGQKYFPISLTFHLRVCTHIFKVTHTDCTYCKRAVYNPDWHDHVALCKKIAPGKHGAGGRSVLATLSSVGYGGANMDGRHPCQVCGRKFTLDRVSTHENVCRRRLASGTIKVEDSAHSVAPPKKGIMTLGGGGGARPKSKQAMPSLRKGMESRGSSKREVKAFAGAGVRLGGYGQEEEEEKRPATTFSGLRKKEPAIKPIESRYRCLKCFSLNKADHAACAKCG